MSNEDKYKATEELMARFNEEDRARRVEEFRREGELLKALKDGSLQLKFPPFRLVNVPDSPKSERG